MVQDASKLGMRTKGNRAGFFFAAERVIPFLFEQDIFPEIAQQQDNIVDTNVRQSEVEREVFNQPTLGQDKFMMPFQVMGERGRLGRQTKRDVQMIKQEDPDAPVSDTELQRRRKGIIGKIW